MKGGGHEARKLHLTISTNVPRQRLLTRVKACLCERDDHLVRDCPGRQYLPKNCFPTACEAFLRRNNLRPVILALANTETP